MKNSNELLTMEEKKNLNPNEIMENGLTREQNEKIQQGADQIQGVVSLFVVGISIYCIVTALSLL